MRDDVVSPPLVHSLQIESKGPGCPRRYYGFSPFRLVSSQISNCDLGIAIATWLRCGENEIGVLCVRSYYFPEEGLRFAVDTYQKKFISNHF
jgi:hypothetical protein